MLMSLCGIDLDVAQHQECLELSSLFYMIEGWEKQPFCQGNCTPSLRHLSAKKRHDAEGNQWIHSCCVRKRLSSVYNVSTAGLNM